MKKIVLTLVAMLSMTTAFAENENMEATNEYTLNINFRSLSRTLELSADQTELVMDIYSAFNAAMLNVAAADDADRKDLIDNALNFNLRNMGAVLEADQFKKYRAILNATVRNRHMMSRH